MNKHCMGGCCHEKTQEVYVIEENEFFKTKTFDHYEHFCDKCPAQYKKWWEDNRDKPSSEAYDCDCFEPTKLVASLMKMNELAQKMLDSIEKKKETEC